MAKRQGARGPRGIPGPPGPAGSSGSRGTQGLSGARGKQGRQGARGATGENSNDAKTTARRRNSVVVSVQRQIDHIHHELKIQLIRMSQIQMEVDELRAKIKHL